MSLTPGKRIRVLVVDDSALMRKLVSEIIAKDPEMEVVGIAANGSIALQKIPQVNPDVITLDIEMPEMDGLTAMREIRKAYPAMKVIMCSTLTEKGAHETIEALSLGAVDYVTKPAKSNSVQESFAKLGDELLPKIKLHSGRPRQPAPVTETRRWQPSVVQPKTNLLKMVCIASSTGGPNALAELFSSFRGPFHLPIVIVQHMPPMFTAMLAQRLDKLDCGIRFHEGAEGQVVEAGHAYIAPGGQHMEVRMKLGRPVLRLHTGTPENSCRPAADVLFRSVAEEYGGKTLAVVLTGMGADGCRGCEQLGSLGARVIAQDEASSVVWGMPGAVSRAGLADDILPLSQIGAKMQELVRRLAPPPVRILSAA